MQLRRNLIVIACCVLCLAAHVAAAENGEGTGPPVRIWFLLYEAGETQALAPLIKELQSSPDRFKAMTYAFGPAVRIASAAGLELDCPVDDCSEVQRGGQLTENVLSRLAWHDAISLVSSFPAQAARQIAAYSRRHHSRIIFYDTGFSLTIGTARRERISAVAPDEIWIPVCAKQAGYARAFPDIPVFTVGQPSLREWIRPLTATERRTIIQLLPQLQTSGKRIMIAGSYGPFYEGLAQRTLQAISDAVEPSEVIFLSSHPTKGWLYDHDLIKRLGGGIIHAPRSIRTSRLSQFCDLVLVFRSTVGLQSALAGRSVCFVEENAGEYEDVALAEGYADVLLVGDIAGKLPVILNGKQRTPSGSILTGGCLPRNPIDIMMERLRIVRRRADTWSGIAEPVEK